MAQLLNSFCLFSLIAGQPDAAPDPPAEIGGVEPAVTAEGPASAPVDAEVAEPDAPGSQPTALDPEARYQACLRQVDGPDREGARACFEQLGRDAGDPLAAAKAQAALDVLWRCEAAASATAAHQVVAPVDKPWIPPGRLELTSTAGLFGAWQGTALGIIASTFLKPGDAGSILLVGGSAVASGVGMGVGGYFLANALELDEAESLLSASGLFWGTVLGINMLPVLNDIGANMQNLTEDDVIRAYLSTVLLAGWAGGGTALALSSLLDVTPGNVSMMNSGGWLGSLGGLTAMAAVMATPGTLPTAAALAYSSLALTGLGAGAAVGSLNWFSRGEVLVGDLGGLLGGIAFGSVALATLAGGLQFGADNQSILYAGGTTTAGALLGYAGTLALVSAFRDWSATQSLAAWTERNADRWVVVPALDLDPRGRPAPGLRLALRF